MKHTLQLVGINPLHIANTIPMPYICNACDIVYLKLNGHYRAQFSNENRKIKKIQEGTSRLCAQATITKITHS